MVSELSCEQQVVEWHLVKIRTPIHVGIYRAEGLVPLRRLSGELFSSRIGEKKLISRQAELLESAPALRAQAVAAEKAKLEGLERSLGISSSEAESSSSGSKRLAELDVEEIARKKHKFDDNAYLEESREINDNVRSAVTAGKLLLDIRLIGSDEQVF